MCGFNPDIFSFSFPPIFISLFIRTLKSSKVLFTINHKTATVIARSDQLASSSLRGEAIAADAASLKCNRQSLAAGIELLQKCRSQFSMEIKSCKLSCEQIHVFYGGPPALTKLKYVHSVAVCSLLYFFFMTKHYCSGLLLHVCIILICKPNLKKKSNLRCRLTHITYLF